MQAMLAQQSTIKTIDKLISSTILSFDFAANLWTIARNLLLALPCPSLL
jgi:hypothetical protein